MAIGHESGVGEEMAQARDGLRSRPEIRDHITGEVRQETMIINMGRSTPRPTGCFGSSSSWTGRR